MSSFLKIALAVQGLHRAVSYLSNAMHVLGNLSSSSLLVGVACMLSRFIYVLTLYDPVDWSPPGSSVQGILQVRILEGVVVPSSRGSCRCRDQAHDSYVSCIWQVGSLPLMPPGKPPGWCYLSSHLCHLLPETSKPLPHQSMLFAASSSHRDP